MGKYYSHLLAPLRIGNTVLKNRMAVPNSLPHYFQGPEKYPAEGVMTFVTNLAKNGAAMITLAEWNDPMQRQQRGDGKRFPSWDTTDPSVENYICQMVDDVHFYGARLLVNTLPVIPLGYTLSGGIDFGSPMGKPGEKKQLLPVEMMDEVYAAFVEKVGYYKSMGYDGLNMRIEHYFPRATNIRTDDYGPQSVENRTRFIRGAMHAVKQAFGPDFIIEITMSGEQPSAVLDGSAGYTMEEMVEFARLAQDDMDVLQLREKDMSQSHPIGYNFRKGQHKCVEYCAAVKDAGINVYTEAIGGMQDPDELDAYIASGKVDMIGMCRAFMADSEYYTKMCEGRGEDITPCLWCNKCHGTTHAPFITVCAVNPAIGDEHKLHRMIGEPGKAKKVAVVGGGPAGMKAAITAAERGHAVTLYEKTDKLGGQLLHADYAEFKWPLKDYKNWLIRQMEKAGVQVVLNTAPTPELLEAEGYEAIYAATGLTPNIPTGIAGLTDANGALKPEYLQYLDVFGREQDLGKKVAIIGGSEAGVDCAMYLADNGHDVTVLTRQNELAHDASPLHYIRWAYTVQNPETGRGEFKAAYAMYDNIHGILNATTTAVNGGTVTYVDAEGEHTIEADSVVICGGMNQNLDEALQFAPLVNHFYIIGDCNKKGNIQTATRDAWSKACMI